ALERLERGVLDNGTLVVSVLSNGGLQQAVEDRGGTVVRTPVGDKYILEGMLVSGASLGGEKSGHVIVREYTTSGDGLVTALEVLRVMTAAGTSLAELARTIPLLPQQQRTVRVRHKDQWEGDPALRRGIADAEGRLGGRGRILVRPSGTEPARPARSSWRASSASNTAATIRPASRSSTTLATSSWRSARGS